MPDRRQGAYACEDDAREALAATARSLGAAPSAACVSLRWHRSGAAGFLVTMPSTAVEPATPDDVAWVSLEDGWPGNEAGADRPTQGRKHPEWRLHRDLYRQRSDLSAIIRSRPVFSTTLACIEAIQQNGVPAFHPDVALAGGDSIRCAARAPFGSSTLSERVAVALESRAACLLADWGLLAAGHSLPAAVALSAMVEALAQIYWQILKSGVSPVE